ncbi:MAG: 16S rRNA (cytidine(1402)-2'-O)-methyltransferase [Hyphomicrobiaceae bacterium]|nr:16S rRNA (cytidine(1402)-2'-O)-methyltransferase [Hyphomicrobiaceae bacterium]
MNVDSGPTDTPHDPGAGTADTQDGVQSENQRGNLIDAAAADLGRSLGLPLAPGLYIVATPIGNLGDITLRALTVLARADIIYCEDTRHSRTLAAHFRLTAPLRPYHEHNGAAERPRILGALAEGRRVALISDAGTPLVSDPGFKLVREAVEAGHRVESLPGASAVLTALTVAGLATDTFLFAGFLPPKTAGRRTRLGELAGVAATLVFYEAPQRLADTLADLASVLGDRQAAVARELTKLHEEVRRGGLGELALHFASHEPRGEIAIVVGPPLAVEVTDAQIAESLGTALRDARLKDASKTVADALGVSRGRVYDIGLAMKRSADEA